MALMDRDNLCGAPRFYMAAKKIGATAHIGAEITGRTATSTLCWSKIAPAIRTCAA